MYWKDTESGVWRWATPSKPSPAHCHVECCDRPSGGHMTPISTRCFHRYMCVCVCMFTCLHVYVCVRLCMYAHVWAYMHVCLSVCMCVYVFECMHVCMCLSLYMCVCVCVCVWVYACVHVFESIHVVCVCVHVWKKCCNITSALNFTLFWTSNFYQISQKDQSAALNSTNRFQCKTLLIYVNAYI